MALNFAELYYVNFFFKRSGTKTSLDAWQGQAQKQAEQGSPSRAGERCLGSAALPGSPLPQQPRVNACPPPRWTGYREIEALCRERVNLVVVRSSPGVCRQSPWTVMLTGERARRSSERGSGGVNVCKGVIHHHELLSEGNWGFTSQPLIVSEGKCSVCTSLSCYAS